jgi:hypothetical protein
MRRRWSSTAWGAHPLAFAAPGAAVPRAVGVPRARSEGRPEPDACVPRHVAEPGAQGALNSSRGVELAAARAPEDGAAAPACQHGPRFYRVGPQDDPACRQLGPVALHPGATARRCHPGVSIDRSAGPHGGGPYAPLHAAAGRNGAAVPRVAGDESCDVPTPHAPRTTDDRGNGFPSTHRGRNPRRVCRVQAHTNTTERSRPDMRK